MVNSKLSYFQELQFLGKAISCFPRRRDRSVSASPLSSAFRHLNIAIEALSGLRDDFKRPGFHMCSNLVLRKNMIFLKFSFEVSSNFHFLVSKFDESLMDEVQTFIKVLTDFGSFDETLIVPSNFDKSLKLRGFRGNRVPRGNRCLKVLGF